MKIKLNHSFVENIPEKLDENVIYVCMDYGTAVHRCACGCGNEVVTPFSPTDWELNYNGENITLYPSIGNWNFKCQSHYWIRDSKVIWAENWTKKEINHGRSKDRNIKNLYFDEEKEPQLKKLGVIDRFLLLFGIK